MIREGERHTLRFRVQDSGLGMNAQQQEKLFQAFTQGDASVTRSYGGTGLGLFISKKIAQLLGGDLYLESSRVSEGSVFILDLDISRLAASAAPSVKEATPRQRRSKELAPARILIVEDMPELRLLAKRMLEIYGAQHIRFASDGLEALEICERESFDVIFMDVEMPNLGGFETVKRLRAGKYTHPIVALTAHAMKNFREDSLKAGFDAYMVKPFQKEELFEMTVRFLPSPMDHDRTPL